MRQLPSNRAWRISAKRLRLSAYWISLDRAPTADPRAGRCEASRWRTGTRRRRRRRNGRDQPHHTRRDSLFDGRTPSRGHGSRPDRVGHARSGSSTVDRTRISRSPPGSAIRPHGTGRQCHDAGTSVVRREEPRLPDHFCEPATTTYDTFGPRKSSARREYSTGSNGQCTGWSSSTTTSPGTTRRK